MGSITGLSSRSLQYYVIGRKWRSKLEFIGFELNFLRYLIDEQLFTVPDTNLRRNAGNLKDELMSLEFQKKNLEGSLQEQLNQLELMAEDVVPEDISKLVAKQISLECWVDKISTVYQELKKQIFTLIKDAQAAHKKTLLYCSPN